MNREGYMALTEQLAARERAAAMQQDQSRGLFGGLQGLKQSMPYMPYGGAAPRPNVHISKGPPTFKEELQDEIDQWLKDI